MKNILIFSIVCTIISEIPCDDINYFKFPDGFTFGASTSSYQTEGAWNVSHKGESVCDRWAHKCPECVKDHSNGDVACDSYHKYKEDVALAKSIGFNYYRFSISWTRILPSGFSNTVNKDGIRYYRHLIKELLDNGIEPIVTLYHFDHPQMFEDMGGWTNALMVTWFRDYARIIFKELGPLVKTFITMNEPNSMCQGYASNGLSPGKQCLDVGYYLCLHNVLKAHAMAYHLYDKEFRRYQRGRIGITNYCQGFLLDDSKDTVSAETAYQFGCGMVANPIYLGDYPKIVKKRLALVSKSQGYRKSRLPVFPPRWISYIKGTSDFFGLNHYTSAIARPDPDEARGKHSTDSGILTGVNYNWKNGSSSWLKVVPEGFRQLLRKIKTDYNNPPVYVIENGFSDYGELRDHDRISFIHAYLKELILAVIQDGCNVLKYTVWSLLDNFEFNAGYTEPFGLVKVDFNSSNRDRTPKLSAFWMNEVIRTHTLQDVPKI